MITIYGKEQCGFCVKAKKFATDRQFKFEYKDVGNNMKIRDEMLRRAEGKVIKTVPQIFIDNQHIGGYTEFTRYVEETGYNGTGESL
tara:strand:+ start:343 stop:603 length:261 start_codon:yes stop_codon:yes gene_type:complete